MWGRCYFVSENCSFISIIVTTKPGRSNIDKFSNKAIFVAQNDENLYFIGNLSFDAHFLGYQQHMGGKVASSRFRS